MESDRLEDLLEDFLQKVHSGLSGRLDEIPETLVRTEEVVELSKEGGGARSQKEFSLRSKKKLDHYLVFQTDVIESKEAEELVQFVEEESDLEIDENYLRRMVLDVFGEEAEYVEDWQSRIDRAFEKLKQDIERQTPLHLIRHHLQGIRLEEDDLELDQGIELRKSKGEDFSREEEVDSPSFTSPNMDIPPTIVEFEAEPRFGRYPPGQARTDLLTTALKLYGAGNVHTVRQKSLPKTYLGTKSESSPNSSQSPHPRYSVEEDEPKAISNLYRLLEEFYSGEDMEFDYPLGVAIDHFESSIQKRTKTRESVTFSIIGLESLYTQGRGKVSTHCAFLLGNCYSDFEPVEIQEVLTDAYDFRSGWVHGGRRKTEKKDIQEKLWNYLRVSIVVFSWLADQGVFEVEKTGRTSNRDLISDALIDNASRERLLQKLDELRIEDYLQIRQSSDS